jgi:hypothetical protein
MVVVVDVPLHTSRTKVLLLCIGFVADDENLSANRGRAGRPSALPAIILSPCESVSSQCGDRMYVNLFLCPLVLFTIGEWTRVLRLSAVPFYYRSGGRGSR